jgi:hypothetical protein
MIWIAGNRALTQKKLQLTDADVQFKKIMCTVLNSVKKKVSKAKMTFSETNMLNPSPP